MNVQFADAFNDLIRERRIDKSVLMETLTAGFSSAAKKKYGPTAEVEIAEDGAGDLQLYLIKTVVEEVENPGSEMPLEEALEAIDDAEVGDQLRIYVPFAEFGRNAIQIAKQILMQKLREFDRERTFEEYADRVGEIVSGSVQQIDRGGILINLGNAEAHMPRKEQIRRERYNQGSSIRACIVKVDKEAKGPMIVLSRTSSEFLMKLFGQEVPEIYEGIIEIKSVAREAGGRSKIAVYSRDDRVDAVGACVGMKGSRVQAVVNELSGERIDIVPWSEDIMNFVTRALSPAKISSVRANTEEKSVLVVVEEDQLSLAIGKDGQNVRLASKLTGWQIDLITSRDLEQQERLQDHLTMAIEEMVGVSTKLAEGLRGAGITTVQKFESAGDEELLEVAGMGPKTLEKLRETARGTMQELERALEELIEKENEEREAGKSREQELFGELDDDGVKPTKGKAKLTEETLFKDVTDDDDEEVESATAEAATEDAPAERDAASQEAAEATTEEADADSASEDAAKDANEDVAEDADAATDEDEEKKKLEE